MKTQTCCRCGVAINQAEKDLSEKLFGKKTAMCTACIKEQVNLACGRARSKPVSVKKPFLFYFLPQILILYCVITYIVMIYVPDMAPTNEMVIKLKHAFIPLGYFLLSGIAHHYHFFGDKLFLLFAVIDTVIGLAMVVFMIAGAIHFVRNGFVPVNIRVTGHHYEATVSGDTVRVEKKDDYGGFLAVFVNILLFLLGLCAIAAGGTIIFAVNVFLSRRDYRRAKKICKRFEALRGESEEMFRLRST